MDMGRRQHAHLASFREEDFICGRQMEMCDLRPASHLLSTETHFPHVK